MSHRVRQDESGESSRGRRRHAESEREIVPQRVWLLSVLFGLAAGLLYAVTVSRGVFPGISAVLMTQVAGLDVPHVPDHPLWRLLAGAVSGLPVLSLPWRLNLLSGLFGGLAVALVFRLMARRTWRLLGKDIADDRDAVRAAYLAGAAAALFLGLSTVCWSAATRLHPACLELVLGLLALNLLDRYAMRGGVALTYLVALLTGFGAVESIVVLALAPFIAVWLLTAIYRRRRNVRWGHILGLAAAGALGMAVALALASRVTIAGGDPGWRALLVALARTQLAELRALVPSIGWVIVLLLGYGPWLLLQFTAKTSLNAGEATFGDQHLGRTSLVGAKTSLNAGRSMFDWLLHVCLTVIALLMMFDIPGTPWARIGRGGRMVVLPYLLTAWVIGYLITYWYVQFRESGDDDVAARDRQRLWQLPRNLQFSDGNGRVPEGGHVSKSRATRKRAGTGPFSSLSFGQLFAGVLTLVLAICLLLAGGLHAREAHGGRGAFMDACAREVLSTLGARTWLASDGTLDPHLQIVAQTEGRPLKLIRLSRDRDLLAIRALQRQIAAEPLFADRTARMQNAAALGTVAFLQEWLSVDTNAYERVAVFGQPVFWAEAGFRANPERLVFGGAPISQAPDLEQLITTHQAFWAVQQQALSRSQGALDYAEIHRRNLLRHMSMVGNSLGVLLQDYGQDELAYQVYAQAMELDPDNVSATINRYALMRGGMHADDLRGIETALAQARERMGAHPLYAVITRQYGEIRAPAVLAAMGWQWNLARQPRLAEREMRRAAETASDSNQPAYLLTLAGMQLGSEDAARGEPIYQRLLEKNPNDTQAILGMVRVELLRGDADAAETWLRRVGPAPATDPAVPLLQAVVQLELGRRDAARKTLMGLVEQHPKYLQAWAMLASLLIAEGRAEEAAKTVLPHMERVTGPAGGVHYLTYLTRGCIEQAKGGTDGLKAARHAFLAALSLRPNLSTVRNEVLKLDYQLNDIVSGEAHAREMLRTDRGHGLANYLLASILIARDEVAAAEDHFRRSVQCKPTALGLNGMAECLRRMGRLDEAATAARQALDLEPKCCPAWDTLACVLLDLRQNDEAVQAARKGLALANDDPRLRLTLARAVIAKGDRTEALAILDPLRRRQDTLPPDVRKAVQDLLGR